MEEREHKSIGKWISILHRQAQVYLNSELKQYGLNSSEYIYLINLAENEGVSQKYLSDMLIIDDAFTTRVIKSLELKGFIVREKNSEDKRLYNIRLSDKGNHIQPVIMKILKNWTAILSENMTEEEIDLTIEKLKRMSGNALAVTKGKKEDAGT